MRDHLCRCNICFRHRGSARKKDTEPYSIPASELNSSPSTEVCFVTQQSRVESNTVSDSYLGVPVNKPAHAPIYKHEIALEGSDVKEPVLQGGIYTYCASQIIDVKHVPEGVQVVTCSRPTVQKANKSPLDIREVALISLRIKTFEIKLPF